MLTVIFFFTDFCRKFDFWGALAKFTILLYLYFFLGWMQNFWLDTCCFTEFMLQFISVLEYTYCLNYLRTQKLQICFSWKCNIFQTPPTKCGTNRSKNVFSEKYIFPCGMWKVSLCTCMSSFTSMGYLCGCCRWGRIPLLSSV